MSLKNLTKRRIIERWVDIILTQYYSKFGDEDCTPIPIHDIVEKLFGIRCEQVSFSNPKVLGLYIPKKRLMYVHHDDSLNRKRFTIAHELAHFLFDSPDYFVVNNEELNHYLNLTRSMIRFNDKWDKENVANYFSAAILAPIKIIKKILADKEVVTQADIPLIANYLGVSQKTLVYRLFDLNEIEDLKIELKINVHTSIANFISKSPKKIQKHKNIFINLDYQYIDQKLIRTLYELKQNCDYLYVVSEKGNESKLETLSMLPCIDGFLITNINRHLLFTTIKTRFSNSRIIYKSSDSWLEWITNSFEINNPKMVSLQVLTRCAEGNPKYEQRELLNMSRIIDPKRRLNNRTDAVKYIREMKSSGKTVVVVTGCFDLITDAHVRFLKKAKATGHVLVVGIEDDQRIRAFKGSLRPINLVHQRVEVLEALSEIVDFIFIIHGSANTDLRKFYTNLHCDLKANILAITEGDPHLEDRKAEIEAGGGRLAIVSRIVENSTTSLVRKALGELPEIQTYLLIPRRLLLDKKTKNKKTNHILQPELI